MQVPRADVQFNSYLEPRKLPILASLVLRNGPSSSDPGTFETAGDMRERRGHIWLYIVKGLRKGAHDLCLHPVG